MNVFVDILVFLGCWTLASMPAAILFGKVCAVADRDLERLDAALAARWPALTGQMRALQAPALALPAPDALLRVRAARTA